MLICSLSTPGICGLVATLLPPSRHRPSQPTATRWTPQMAVEGKSEIVQWHVTLLYLLRPPFYHCCTIMHTGVQKLASVDVHLCHCHCEDVIT